MRPLGRLRSRMRAGSIAYARSARLRPSEAESLLWERIRARRLGPKFRRKYPLLGYVADFAAPLDRLVIEIDRGHISWTREAAMQQAGIVAVKVPEALVREDLEAAVRVMRKLSRAFREGRTAGRKAGNGLGVYGRPPSLASPGSIWGPLPRGPLPPDAARPAEPGSRAGQIVSGRSGGQSEADCQLGKDGIGRPVALDCL